jgi:PAS domain S-box-containing protein
MADIARILYMEDNEGTARLLQKRLSRLGYAIDIAPNGEAGLEQCEAQPYDVIIVDHNMPGLSGLQVIQRLATLAAMPPTIMLTGTGNERIAVEALKLGAIDYVVKDVDGVYLELLPTVLEQSLKHRRLLEEKRRTEEALIASEQRFRSVIEQSLDGITLIDQEGKIVEWNRAEAQITGIPVDEAEGQYIWDMSYRLTPPDLQPQLQAIKAGFQQVLQNQHLPASMHEHEYELIAADGVRRAVLASRFFIMIGNRPLLCEISRDITARKRSEEALRESEQRFRTLFELAPDAYIITDLEGRFSDINHSGETLLGTTREALLGKSIAELQVQGAYIDPSEYKSFLKSYSSARQQNEVLHTEIRIRRQDGQVITVEINATPITLEEQPWIIGNVRNITWRKEAEKQMRAHIEQLEILSRIEIELTRKLDMNYVQAMAIDNMRRLSNATSGSISIIGEAGVLSVYSVGYPEVLNEQYTLDNRSISARVAQRREAEWIQDVTTDPDYFMVLASTRSQITIPLVSQERLIGVVNLETDQPDTFNAEMFEFLKLIAVRIAIAIDNAQLYDNSQKQFVELQNLYDQVSLLEELKTDMVRIVSHDLSNLLSVVMTSVQLLQRSLGSKTSDTQRRYVEQLINSVLRMRTLTTDVLSLENIERLARGEVDANEVNFRELIRDIVESYRTKAERKEQIMTFFAPDLPVLTWSNKTELQQAASNLIDNAIKYTPEGRQIDILVQPQDGMARFEVIDSGYGIPESEQADLFQPFKRVKIEETRSIEGTGLGLYIVRKIIERNGGEVIFSSEFGKGSIFGFTLPLMQP